jgi:hypothetical protein
MPGSSREYSYKKTLATLPQAQQGLLTKTNRSMRKTFRVKEVM